MPNGLFVGMVTLDLVYLSSKLPSNNEKITASDYTISAGGPATNAAVTFGYLGNRATLLTVLGNHPLTQLMRQDVERYGVTIADLNPTLTNPPSVSSIIVTEDTGERAVISINAAKIQARADQIPPGIDAGIDLILIDGHQMMVSSAIALRYSKEIAKLAKANRIPVIIDGGSWKPGFETVLPLVDYAICSANFYPPGCHHRAEVFAYLTEMGIPHIAITQGEKPVQYLSLGESGEILVPQIQAVDTLGAGDIFHGAFCHYILQENFTQALEKAAQVAANSCKFFGTRQWME